MARHRYRVTQRLPWIEGGRPGPNFTWVGGKPIVYPPGTIIVVDDREVGSIVHCLEATDEVGRALLERARAAIAAPAQRTMLTDLHPAARAWVVRAQDEKLRQDGRILELVLRMLERGDDPTREDLTTAALQAGKAVPVALKDHVFEVFKRPQRPGPKRQRRTTWDELAIKAYYQYELDHARDAHERDSRRPANVKHVAATATARAFSKGKRKISKRTVERIVASFSSRPWLRDRPPT